MLKNIVWTIVPQSLPTVLRNCPKCGNSSEFENSGNFRVNANQNNIDVWLIYQCRKCKTTWNMDILSRVHSSTISKERYIKFMKNDSELAARYAFDAVIHSKNKSVLNYENISYQIFGEDIVPKEISDSIYIELKCDYPIEIRVDKIISKKLGVSRELIKELCKQGKIIGEGIKDIGKAKVKNGMVIVIKPL